MKTIRFQNTGEDVCYLQQLLKEQGYPLEKTGTFDESTRQAITAFQKKHQLDADGIVGYRSWETLFFAERKAGERLSEEDFTFVARLLDVETAALKAVQEVETGGRGGFFAPGKPAILFEGHIFWNQLKKHGINPEEHTASNENILYPKWEKGHYKGGLGEYERLEKARAIHHEAADASASWGMFQVMGFNYAACDEMSVSSFVQAMTESEQRQLILAGRFIKKSGMLPALQTRNWAEFAKRYNGPAYAQNKYDEKLAAAYLKYK